MPTAHLAIDLGASSGRAMVGLLSGSPAKLTLQEVHRFEHLPCATPTGPVWDLTGIWHNILTGLKAGATWCQKRDTQLVSVGVDAWGVDWALLGESEELLALPHCYRDPQNEAAFERVLERLGGFEALYERTGIQRMALNTLFQVAARHAAEPKLFAAASRLVFLPDLWHFWLSGKIVSERTIASTSSMLAVESGDWDRDLLHQLDLPDHLWGPIVEAGTPVGTLREEIVEQTGAPAGLRVIAPASHDTAAAVAAVPAVDNGTDSWAYLSSGTWSLIGAELEHPIVTPEGAAASFTNERGVGNTIRYLKNVTGLWLIQELQRELADAIQQKGADKHAVFAQQAQQAPAFRAIIDPLDSLFIAPGGMVDRIKSFARRTGQPEPDDLGQLARCCLESLALCYRHLMDKLESLCDRKFKTLHIVGGGTQNEVLNRFTADATGRSLVIGPIEATAAGNVLTQAMGCGEINGLPEMRAIVARSFDLERIEPQSDAHAWDSALERYIALVR